MTTDRLSVTRWVRTQGGRVVHERTCRYVAKGGPLIAPWPWADQYPDLDVLRLAVEALVGGDVRFCRVCCP